MSEDVWGDEEVTARLVALERFGFSMEAMEAFLSEHEGGARERVAWLEDRRDTLSEIEDRIVALTAIAPTHTSALEPFKDMLDDPFSAEEVYAEFERFLKRVVAWEPSLNRAKPTWYENGDGEAWALLYRRLAALDESSLPSTLPLHPLFDEPERYDELFRHLETIELDEQRQRDLVLMQCEALATLGYDVVALRTRPLLEALAGIEAWQVFHAKKEGVRLLLKQLIRPFDEVLTTEFEQRCNALSQLGDDGQIAALTDEIQALGRTLEDRRQELSAIIEGWRGQGIVFPHTGELRPSDLMEWEANVDMVSISVEEHLRWVRKWERFAKYWPSRCEPSKPFIGSLEHTERLRDAVESLDALWKKAELDALDLLQSYERSGLAVEEWQKQVFEDPLNALERMSLRQAHWDRKITLIEQLGALDDSFSGEEDIALRREVLAMEASTDDVLDEMEAFIDRFRRRTERHRVMLEEEIAGMRQAGMLPRDVPLDALNLRELENHVAGMQRGSQLNGAEVSPLGNLTTTLLVELNGLKERGWSVDGWIEQCERNPSFVARSLSEARPYLNQHDVLRRRLQLLPWNRDLASAAVVELEIKQVERLASLHQRIPELAARLSERPVEDERFSISLWQPSAERPTLMPVPESLERPVLKPKSALEDAHEAMLEAMEEGPVPQQAQAPPPPPAKEESPVVRPPPTSTVGNASKVEPRQPSQIISTTTEERVSVVAEPSSSNEGTDASLVALTELLSLLNKPDLAKLVEDSGLNAMGDVRRGLAQHVNVVPRDVRIARLLRITLRLLPDGGEDDGARAELLVGLKAFIPVLKRWMRRRLEARHSGARGDFLADAKALGTALERIPGLGQRVPLQKDEWPLPHDIHDLKNELERLRRAVQLPSAGGVQA